jgi:hypothetical protein
MLSSTMELIAASFMDDLYRFALLSTGDRGVALACIAEVLPEAESNASQWRTQRHRFLWTARLLALRLAKKNVPGAPSVETLPSPLPELRAALNAAQPDLRPSLALHCTGDVKSSEVIQLFRLRSREWRAALVKFREQMASAGFPEERVHQCLSVVKLSPEERLLLEVSATALPVRRRQWDKALAVAAVFLGVCVFLGWFGWERWRDSPSILMRSHMENFLEVNRSAGITGLEPFEGRASESQDWLFLHGIEGVRMPESFAGVKVAAARILQWNGSPLALFPTLSPPGLLVVVDAEALHLPEENSESGRSSFADWSGAWESAGPYKVLWMVQSDAKALEQYLEALSEPAQGR